MKCSNLWSLSRYKKNWVRFWSSPEIVAIIIIVTGVSVAISIAYIQTK